MMKTLMYSLAAIMAVGFVAPVMAQDNFPDVPDNHWAYEALGKMMKDGILVGYPDGLFRGPRPASRYEMAVAVNAAYQKLAGQSAGLSDKIDQLQKMIEGAPSSSAELQDLRNQLADLKSSLDGMKGYGDDIASLKKLANTFEKELASLGVDVESMKKDLADLSKRVGELEKIKPAVAISGDVNLLVLAGYSVDDEFGITPSGRLFGFGKGSYFGKPVGVSRDLNILHETALTFKGTNEEGPKWHATLVIGNLFPTVGDMATGALGVWNMDEGSGSHMGRPFFDGESTDIAFETFGVSFDTSLLGQGFSAEVGRLGYQIGPYLFKRPDYTDYYKNERWDNGNYIFDGALLKFKFGSAGLDVFGGRNSQCNNDKGVNLTPITNPSISAQVDQSLGAVLGVKLGGYGDAKAAYVMFDTNNPMDFEDMGMVNRLTVWGAEVNLQYRNFKFNGNYAKTPLTYNTSKVNDSDDDAFDVNLAYDAERWGAKVAYREIKSYFFAPGDWGRIGSCWNPRNGKGFNGSLWFAPTEPLKIWGKVESDEVKDANLPVTGPMGIYINAHDLDKVLSYTVGLDYKLNTNWTLGLSYEDVKWQRNTMDDLKERWYNLALGYNLGPNTSLSLGYMICDNDYAAAEFPRFKGGLITTQFTVKF